MEDPLRRVNEWKLYVAEKICPTGWFTPQPSTTVRPPSTYKPTDWPYQDVHVLRPPSRLPPPLPHHGPVQNTGQLDPTSQKIPARLLLRQNTKQIRPAEPPHQDKHAPLPSKRSRAGKMARRRRENNKPPPEARKVPGSGRRNDSQTKPITSNNTSNRPALLHRLGQGAKSPDEPPPPPHKDSRLLPPTRPHTPREIPTMANSGGKSPKRRFDDGPKGHQIIGICHLID